MKQTLLLLALGVATAFASHAAAPPNIVLVMTDDQGYGDLGCTGNPFVKTPHLDTFYAQSVRFTDFHVSPTCAPTRAALMTGRHEFKNGVTHTILERERLTLKATTLAQVLKDAGYSTGIFGKWHLGDEADYRPERRGFDEVYIHGGGGIGQTFPGSCGDAPGNRYFNPVLWHNGRFVKTSGYCTDLFFGEATTWIDRQRRKSQPFFAYVALNAAHAPLECPEAYFKRYRGQVSDLAAKFYGMIENIDDQFGALMQKLEAWGLTDNTLVVFLTDNGGTVGVEHFNGGRRGGKNTPYQGGTRVPSFWRWPAGFRGGKDCGVLSAHIDILPTLAEITGRWPQRGLEKQVEGRSLLPLLRDPRASAEDRHLVTHIGRWERGKAAEAKWKGASIRDARYSLVNDSELYDLKSDPGEAINLIVSHPDVVAKLRVAYDFWWESVQPLLVNEQVVGPVINPFKELYWRQFGGGPDEALRRLMDPANAQSGRH